MHIPESQLNGIRNISLKCGQFLQNIHRKLNRDKNINDHWVFQKVEAKWRPENEAKYETFVYNPDGGGPKFPGSPGISIGIPGRVKTDEVAPVDDCRSI